LKTSKVLRAARDEKQIFALGSSGVAEPGGAGGKVCLDGKLAIFPADKGKGIAHHEACILTLSVNTALLMTLSRRILTIMQAGYSVSSGRVRQSDFFQYRISHL
jgi:hypothetical protein